MRLVCPNCDAEYEVDAGAIPDSGRDVQCSNCGHAWFQMAPAVEAEIAAEQALYDAPPPVAAPYAAGVETAVAVDETEALMPADPKPQPAPDHAPRSIDESVLAVLREEAEREVEARKTEAPVVETQTDLGLEAPVAGGAVARRLARLKGEPEPVIKAQTRREMLPEIEEINSTLRASTERRSGGAAIAEVPEDEAGKRSSFRSGFTLVLVVAVALLAAYVMAPKLAQQFPAAAGALQAYVAAVDGLRVGIDGLLRSAIGFLKGLAGGA